MKVTVECNGMACEIVTGSHLVFKHLFGGTGTAKGVEAFIEWEDIPAPLMKKVESLERRANMGTFDLIRTALMCHTMEFSDSLSVMEVISAAQVSAPDTMEDAA